LRSGPDRLSRRDDFSLPAITPSTSDAADPDTLSPCLAR